MWCKYIRTYVPGPLYITTQTLAMYKLSILFFLNSVQNNMQNLKQFFLLIQYNLVIVITPIMLMKMILKLLCRRNNINCNCNIFFIINAISYIPENSFELYKVMWFNAVSIIFCNKTYKLAAFCH